MNPNTHKCFSRLLLVTALSLFSAESAAQRVAFAWVDPAGAGTNFVPTLGHQFNFMGSAISVQRVTANAFDVTFPAFGGLDNGALLASAYDGPHTAVVRYWNAAGNHLVARVELYLPSGAPANDAAFTISYRWEGEPTNREAYLWANQPATASYTPDPVYSWNGNRADPTIVRYGTGRYGVTLPGLAALGTEMGHPQVTPYGTLPRRAKISSWNNVGSDLRVQVRCYDSSGNLADSQFVLSYDEGGPPIPVAIGSGAYVWADQPTTDLYRPNEQYTTSNGLSGPADNETVERLALGHYRVNLPNLANWQSANAQVTAHGSDSRYASIRRWTADGCGGTNVFVRTYDPSGTPADSKFLLQFINSHPAAREAWAWVDPTVTGPTFTPDPAYQYCASGGTITVTRNPLTATYTVEFPGMAGVSNCVMVTPYGGNHSAVIGTRYTVGDDLFVEVKGAGFGRFTIHCRVRGSLEERAAYAFVPYNFGGTIPAWNAWNGDRGAPTVTRTGTGSYSVLFPGLMSNGSERGHVQVTPLDLFGSVPHASVVSWSHSPAGVTALVECRVGSGLADCPFFISYHETAAPIARSLGSGAHVWANNPSATNYSPMRPYTDSNGNLGPENAERVYRLGRGHYRVHLPNVAPSNSSTAQVSAYGSGSRHATVERWFANLASGTDVYVQTWDAAGNPIDSQFNLLYLTNRPVAQLGTNTSIGTGCNGPVLSGITRPVLCRDWHLALDGVPFGATLGFVQLDVANPNLTIGPNAPGCTAYTGGAATVLLLLPIPDPAYSLTIPAATSFLGVELFAQGGALVPGLNPYGLAASNGLRGRIGER